MPNKSKKPVAPKKKAIRQKKVINAKEKLFAEHMVYENMGCIEAAHRGELKFGFCLGGNLYGSNPDQHYADQALSHLETLVFMSTTLNTGHAHGLADEKYCQVSLEQILDIQLTLYEAMMRYELQKKEL